MAVTWPAQAVALAPARSIADGRFRCTGVTGGPTKIISGANGCMDLSRTRVLPTRAAATFRIRLIMERGSMRQRISPGSDYAGPRRWDDVEMTPGMALEDVWI
jgi:hypothetical protein